MSDTVGDIITVIIRGTILGITHIGTVGVLPGIIVLGIHLGIVLGIMEAIVVFMAIIIMAIMDLIGEIAGETVIRIQQDITALLEDLRMQIPIEIIIEDVLLQELIPAIAPLEVNMALAVHQQKQDLQEQQAVLPIHQRIMML